jgi:hypothetical protein
MVAPDGKRVSEPSHDGSPMAPKNGRTFSLCTIQVLDGRFRLFALMRVSFASKVVLMRTQFTTCLCAMKVARVHADMSSNKGWRSEQL